MEYMLEIKINKNNQIEAGVNGTLNEILPMLAFACTSVINQFTDNEFQRGVIKELFIETFKMYQISEK